MFVLTDIWFIVLVFTGVAVILSGLVGLICLCRYASKYFNVNINLLIKQQIVLQNDVQD